MTDELSSTRNPRVRAAAALSRRRERRATGRHLVEGPRAVGEALAAGVVTEVFVVPERRGELPETGPAVTVTTVAEHVLAHLADAASPQGVVAVARTPAAGLDAVSAGRLVVALDAVADPGNVGTIVRTADAAGADGVVLTPGCADPFGPKAVRAAVGSTYHLPIVVDVALDDLVADAVATGRRTAGLDARGDRSVFDLGADDGPLVLVLGSEAHGLSDPDALDELLAVPIARRAESLNVAAAAAVAVFAAARALATGRAPEPAD